MFENVQTPCYIVDEKKIKDNLKVLRQVQKASGCKILLAQKAFSMYALYPLIGEYLCGTTASGLYEAQLGAEEMQKENHVYAPAYKEEDMHKLVNICDHLMFNSFSQYEKYKELCLASGLSLGIRINPECSTQREHSIYDPCAEGSRLGVTRKTFTKYQKEKMGITVCTEEAGKGTEALENVSASGKKRLLPEGIEGLHFHTLCEQNSDDLVTTFRAFEEKFSKELHEAKWLNMGGGHHITRPDYDWQTLVDLILYIKETYDVEVYLEPGEAIALNAGYLVAEVMDIVGEEPEILILDASAACHMPDVLEMPYRPPLKGGFLPGEKLYKYKLSSLTCLAGDVIGEYSFEKEVKVGDHLVFEDMAIYSMVKNNTFNGIPLPSIHLLREDGSLDLVKEFGYEDFKRRL